MQVVVFANQRDSSIEVLGKALFKLLDRKYFVFTREPSDYPICPVDKTMTKLREIASHTEDERFIVSFGCRVLPNNIKTIENLGQKHAGNLVVLKKLRGSKTWHETKGVLTFENERIADCGIFILTKKDILATTHLNFNSYIRYLLSKNQLEPEYIDFWLFSNNQKSPNVGRK
jgi:hypothetical protein